MARKTKVKQELVGGMYVLKKELAPYSIIELTPELVENLNKLVKERVKLFSKEYKKNKASGRTFMVHLSPNISFVVRY